MAIDPTIFRGYDVRARHEDQLTDEAVEATAFSYAAHTGAKRVAMGWDMRRSSPRIVSALSEGLLKAGVDVVHIGLCTTPMLYFAVGSDETIDGGLMVTASHCTTEMNGVKLCRADVQPIGFGSGMEDIRDRALRGERHHARRRGTLETRDVKPAFFDHLFSVAGDMDLSGMSVVFDAGNSVASVVLPEIIARLGVEHTDLYFDLDDTFPNHEANPVKTETMHDLRAMVRAKGAHVGFAYDGDADRIGVVDETGAIVSSDYVLLLLAQALLKKEAGALVLSDIGCTRDVERGVTQMGGRHLSTPVGHAHIKRMMHEHGGALAGEYSGHMYFREMFRAESTMLATLLLLNILRASGAPLSSLIARIKTYVHSGETNYHVDDTHAAMRELEERFGSLGGARVSHLDGLKVDFPTWWMSVRPSANDPVLRLRVEGSSHEEMTARRDEIVNMLYARGAVKAS